MVRTVVSLAERAYEMDTSELHRFSILSAARRLTTDRSTFPKTLNTSPDEAIEMTAQSDPHAGLLFLTKIA